MRSHGVSARTVSSAGNTRNDVCSHGSRQFALADEHLPRVLPLEQCRLLLVVGAHDDLDARIERAGGFDHLSNFNGLRVAMTSMRASVTCAWINVAGSTALP